ncbi:TPA: ABC transporter ATP-binding protein [Escherichia albertii]|uniref:ABC transporter ATP-binding protein n=1 Tax=Escherichia albertii TaxID=208962 RepID=UPI00074451C2|nr:ABC transporter ATP-binding protein [Escherichia albertii]MCV3220704.1 ABC transporter ATP-binding protein [Escherichia albertii]MCV3225070.1 ABC transporter ATP-binding protein [Escherichia albertii]MCV3236743.1 ABC transporter ATP-binding protein [Escherichia albertii]MCV3247416.1 ABC transporter ATP-binding protein [Escherichia albertii]MCV3260828.1 ABC transporter ATP-binding protein [Escherichia albertii]
MTDSRLGIKNLCIDYPGSRVVNNVSFTLGNERLALVGESGSGKSMTARALMGLIRKPGRVTADTLNILGRNALTLNARGWQQLRGNDIAMVLQDPRYALNPVKTVKAQLEEAITLHQRLNRCEKEEKINTAIQAVGLNTRVLQNYPRELSGGMGQRVMIAMALINDPQVLIADEPTSALDVRLRNQILELLVTQCEQRQMAMLLISHDLPLVAQFCHRVMVMYQGNKIDEMRADALPTATHPYTRTLWTCRPNAQTYGQILPTLDRTAMTLEKYHDGR